MSNNSEQMMVKMSSYVLKQGSPDISCVVMTTCNRHKKIINVSFRLTTKTGFDKVAVNYGFRVTFCEM